LNTFVYIGIILLTYYQANKLSHQMLLSYFIKIAPSIGAWIGLISSFVLIFISGYGSSKSETVSFQSHQSVMYPPQNPYPQQKPPAANTQGKSYTNAQSNIQAQPITQAQTNIQAQFDIRTQPNIQTQPGTQEQSQIQAQQTNEYNMSARPEDTQKPEDTYRPENTTRPEYTQNQEEIEIARLGSGYSVVIKGGSKSTGATLTDKRLYLSGELFKSDVGNKLKKTTLMYAVDLQDIVGMEFKVKRKTGLLVTAIIFLVLSLLMLFAMLAEGIFFASQLNIFLFPSIFFFLIYSVIGAKLFVVHTKTGSVGFDVRIAGQAEVEKFAQSIQAAQNAFRV